jgi:hypothetical protein
MATIQVARARQRIRPCLRLRAEGSIFDSLASCVKLPMVIPLFHAGAAKPKGAAWRHSIAAMLHASLARSKYLSRISRILRSAPFSHRIQQAFRHGVGGCFCGPRKYSDLAPFWFSLASDHFGVLPGVSRWEGIAWLGVAGRLKMNSRRVCVGPAGPLSQKSAQSTRFWL